MQQRVYQTKICSVSELKERLITVWNDLGQSVISDAIDEWRKRLRANVRAREKTPRAFALSFDL